MKNGLKKRKYLWKSTIKAHAAFFREAGKLQMTFKSNILQTTSKEYFIHIHLESKSCIKYNFKRQIL